MSIKMVLQEKSRYGQLPMKILQKKLPVCIVCEGINHLSSSFERRLLLISLGVLIVVQD